MENNYLSSIKVNKAGYSPIAVFAIITIILFFISKPLAWIGVVLTVWCIYFFRDPERVTPVKKGLVIAAADGVVQLIDIAPPPAELGLPDDPMRRVCIFMNVFNVHVNRIPCDGTIITSDYRPGRFMDASLDKASTENERMSFAMKTDTGDNIAFVQIAGLVARRIVSELKDNQEVKTGQRFGLIRFGSRVDIYLPLETNLRVGLGQIMVAGETVIANLEDNDSSKYDKFIVRYGDFR